LGPHVYGQGIFRLERPDRGYAEVGNRDVLMETRRTHSLRVMNTWFARPDSGKATYAPPGAPAPVDGAYPPAVFAELDFFLASDRWTGMVLDVKSVPAAGLPTDHHPVEAWGCASSFVFIRHFGLAFVVPFPGERRHRGMALMYPSWSMYILDIHTTTTHTLSTKQKHINLTCSSR